MSELKTKEYRNILLVYSYDEETKSSRMIEIASRGEGNRVMSRVPSLSLNQSSEDELINSFEENVDGAYQKYSDELESRNIVKNWQNG